MSERILVDAIGAVIELDVSALDAHVQQRVRDVWRDAQVEGDNVQAHDVVIIEPTASDDEVLAALTMRVTYAALEARRGECWMIHAAGLADHGRVVALVAPSGTGKTTASRELSRHYRYVSDETVAVDAVGRVLPYRKPLSVIPPEGGAKLQVPPSEFEAHEITPDSLRLAKVAVLDRRDDGPARPVLTPLSTVEALSVLAPQTSYLCDLPRPLHTVESLLEATGGAVKVTYSEAATLVDVVAQLFDEPISDALLSAALPAPGAGRGPERSDPCSLSGPSDACSLSERGDACSLSERGESKGPDLVEGSKGTPATSDRFFHGAFVDVLTDSAIDQLVVLRRADDGSGMLNVLGGIAPTLWGAAHGASFADLVDETILTYGEPEGVDAGALVRAAVDELLESGILSKEPMWRVGDDVAWTGGEDRVTALNLAAAAPQPTALEGSAVPVWHLLATSDGLTQNELVSELVERFNGDAEAIAADVAVLLSTLRSEGLAEY
jgi:hypothetical protein